MAGVTLETRVVGDAAIRAFTQLALHVTDTRPTMRAIGVALVENVHQRFERGSGPGGEAWAPLNPEYAKGKKGPGILRESGMRGGLMGSITRHAGHDYVEVGTNKIYGAIHQFGGVIQPKSADRLYFQMGGKMVAANSVTIPARPYLGIDHEDEQVILETLVDAIDRAIGLR